MAFRRRPLSRLSGRSLGQIPELAGEDGTPVMPALKEIVTEVRALLEVGFPE